MLIGQEKNELRKVLVGRDAARVIGQWLAGEPRGFSCFSQSPLEGSMHELTRGVKSLRNTEMVGEESEGYSTIASG